MDTIDHNSKEHIFDLKDVEFRFVEDDKVYHIKAIHLPTGVVATAKHSRSKYMARLIVLDTLNDRLKYHNKKESSWTDRLEGGEESKKLFDAYLERLDEDLKDWRESSENLRYLTGKPEWEPEHSSSPGKRAAKKAAFYARKKKRRKKRKK